MIWQTSAGVRRFPPRLLYRVFKAQFEYGGLMAAVGCRKSAIFDQGSNLWGLRLIKMKKNMTKKE